MIPTTNKDFFIRFATEKDVPLIFSFIKGLAEYEKMIDHVSATHESLLDSIFIKKQAEVIIGELNDIPIGFALFFHNYSTFLGKANLYLEDLFILEKFRHQGFGKIMLSFLAKLAIERNCSRFDWTCLNWNQPSIDFYEKIGAIPLKDWMIFRLKDEALNKLANEFNKKSE